MSIEVLLMADVKDLGSEGDVVTVTDGYARNCLLPGKLAANVTEATRRRLASIRKKRDATAKAELADSQKMVDRLSNISCTIPVKTGDDGKMYGSVSANDIISVVATQGVELDKNCITLDSYDGHIKELGVYDVEVVLHPKVKTTIKVWVVEE